MATRTLLPGLLSTLLLGLLLAPAPSRAVTEYVVQWESSDASADGYLLYVGTASHQYGTPVDLGAVVPDTDGIRRYPLIIDETLDHYLAMSAYNGAGQSALSNEIEVMAAATSCDPTLCDDGNACTVDDCSATGSGCTHAPLPDGSLCAADGSTCLAGQCRLLECLSDADCSDGDACNGTESCSAGSCVAGTAPSCGQPTQCTVPACDPATGCTQVAVADGTACDDGLSTTTGDVCLAGTCQGTPTASGDAGSGSTAAALAVDAIDPASVGVGGSYALQVYGAGFLPGTRVAFLNGNGPSPTTSSVQVVDPGTLAVALDVRRGGPKRSRSWDVVVTLPDGRQAVLPQALEVVP